MERRSIITTILETSIHKLEGLEYNVTEAIALAELDDDGPMVDELLHLKTGVARAMLLTCTAHAKSKEKTDGNRTAA